MVRLKLDGKGFTVREGSTILEVAREHDIPIPTLCYCEEVSPGGRCRLCAVEIISPKRKRPVVLACAYRVKEGLEVRTHSKAVVASRKGAMEVLLARAPHAERVRQMAGEMGMDMEPSPGREKGCILCGLCVRACREIVGRGAIAMARGKGRKGEDPPIRPSPERCIACATCAQLCPTGFISVEDWEGVRIMWNKAFKEKEHLISGRFYPPVDLIECPGGTGKGSISYFFHNETSRSPQNRKRRRSEGKGSTNGV